MTYCLVLLACFLSASLQGWVEMTIALPETPPAPSKNCFYSCMNEWIRVTTEGLFYKPLDCSNRCEQGAKRYQSEMTLEQQAYILNLTNTYNGTLDGDQSRMIYVLDRLKTYYSAVDQAGGITQYTFRRFDTVADGRITLAEYSQLITHWNAQLTSQDFLWVLFNAADLNQDGELSLAEFSASNDIL